jgi:hypothetical protein
MPCALPAGSLSPSLRCRDLFERHAAHAHTMFRLAPAAGVPLVLTVDAAALADAGSRASLALAAVANAQQQAIRVSKVRIAVQK